MYATDPGSSDGPFKLWQKYCATIAGGYCPVWFSRRPFRTGENLSSSFRFQQEKGGRRGRTAASVQMWCGMIYDFETSSWSPSKGSFTGSRFDRWWPSIRKIATTLKCTLDDRPEKKTGVKMMVRLTLSNYPNLARWPSDWDRSWRMTFESPNIVPVKLQLNRQ